MKTFVCVGHSIAKGGGSLGVEGFKCYVGDIKSQSEAWQNAGSYANGGGVTQNGPHPFNQHSGVNGDQIPDVDARWAADVQAHNPTDVFLWVGVTDIQSKSVAVMQSELAALLANAYLLTPSVDLWVRTIAYRINEDVKVSQWDAELPNVLSSSPWPASQASVFVSRTHKFPNMYPDGVHLDTAGHYMDALQFCRETA